MSTKRSRGESPSSYIPGFKQPSGMKVRQAEIRSQVISGTLISGNIVYAVNHQLGVVPRTIMIQARTTKAQAAVAASAGVFVADQTSATTSAKFYVCGTGKGIVYDAFLLV